MLTVIAEYLIIYLLAKKTIVNRSLDLFDPVVSNVKTPYSLIITSIAMLFKSSIIVYLIGKIRSLPEDSPVNSETRPPPYQSFSNVGSTPNDHYTTNTTRRPFPRSRSTPEYYGSSDATQPLLSEPREVFPNYQGANTTERPLPNAPVHNYNPFDERSDHPWSTSTLWYSL